MDRSIQPCFTHPSGKDIYLYSLRNINKTEVLISNYGAIVLAYKIHMPDGTDQTFPFLLGPNPDPTCQGPDCKSSFGGSRPPVPIKTLRKRVYWYVDKHDN